MGRRTGTVVPVAGLDRDILLAAIHQPRKTKQREAIREAFLESDRPLSPDEVKELARLKVKNLNLATVYRNLKSLLEEKWLIPVEIPGTVTRYEVAGKERHYHFLCDRCKKLFDIQGYDSSFKPKLPRGFRAAGHQLIFYGTCAACAKLTRS